jgi:hypothetical protein
MRQVDTAIARLRETATQADARTVHVALTEEQARQTALWLRGSASHLDDGLRAAWEHTPVGETWAILRAAVGDDESDLG